jgi:3-isopropylmalate/(R)-2-methylmalate dehydratase large subunit
MEGRMTVCNMSIEGGARAGLIAPDETTFAYLKDKPLRAEGCRLGRGARGVALAGTDEGAAFDRTVHIDAADVAPDRDLGDDPGQSVRIGERIPTLDDAPDEGTARQWQRAFDYMGISGGGERSATCSSTRSSSAPAPTADRGPACGRRGGEGPQGRRRDRAMVVPGSGLVKAAAEAEGIAEVLIEAGFDWRDPGCSMCLGMNPDQLAPGERARRPPTATSRAAGLQGPHPPRLARRWPPRRR